MKTFQQMATERKSRGEVSLITISRLPATRKFDTVGEMIRAYIDESKVTEREAMALVRKDHHPDAQGKGCYCIWVNPKNAYGAYWGYAAHILNW